MGLLFHKLNQPVVLGYLIAGMIVGPHTPPHPLVSDIPNIKIWGELGVIFLMFSLGLEFSFRKLARVGFQDIDIPYRRPLGIDDCALYPLFDPDTIALMRRLVPPERQHAVAVAVVVRARGAG